MLPRHDGGTGGDGGSRGGTSRTTLNAALDDFWNCALAFGAAFNLVDAAFTSLR
jgi:hypothetical protein